MQPPSAIEAALGALEGSSFEAGAIEALRDQLQVGERVLFDRAIELRRNFVDLHARVLRSAVLAEASLGNAAFVHELRQCLSPLIGLAELMKESPQSPFLGSWVTEISAQATRVAGLLDRHAELLRVQVQSEEPCDLEEVAIEAGRYFSHLPPGVQLKVDIAPNLPRAVVGKRQLLHALLNLIANARDAHLHRPGIIGLYARQRGGQAELLVTDQGSGIDPAVRGRLFEPLFTTKKEDGTGLGLFLSRELLGPKAELVLLDREDAPPGVSTAFAIRMPVALDRSPARDASAPPATQAAPVSAGPDRSARAAPDRWTSARRQLYERIAPLVGMEPNHPVLIVEDEPAVRRMTRAVLESVGSVKIYEAADAAFAFGHLEKFRVDFLVCDKNLPDQDGLEVIRRARKLYPTIDAMIVTGYPSADSAAEAIRVGATDYLIKPIRELKTLRESVASALLRQRLHRLLERHGTAWGEMARPLLAQAPEEVDRNRIGSWIVQLSSNAPSGPPQIAIVGEPELLSRWEGIGAEWVTLAQASDLARVGQPLDLVAFPAERVPEMVRELVKAARVHPSAPHLLAVGRFKSTDTAVAALQGRTSVVLDRAWSPSEAKNALHLAASRRRREARADALAQLLHEIGFRL